VQGGPVELDVVADDAELGGALRLVEDLGRPQDRLGWDAGVVEAAPAGFVALDDRGLLAQLRGADGGDVTARAPADDDLVEGVGHAAAEPIEGAAPGSAGAAPSVRASRPRVS